MIPTPNSGDLSSFWTWFNAIFGPTLGAVLPVVAVVAGGLFVFFVARMIVGTLRGLAGGGAAGSERPALQDPLGDTGVFEGSGYEVSPALRTAYYERLEILRSMDRQFPDERRGYVIGPDGEKRGRLRAGEIRFLLQSDDGSGLVYGGVKKRSPEYQVIAGAIRYAVGNEYSPVGRSSRRKGQHSRRNDPLFLLPGSSSGRRGRRGRADDALFLVGGSSSGRRGRRGRDDSISLLPSAPARRGGRRGRADDGLSLLGDAPVRRGRQAGGDFFSLIGGGDRPARRTRRRSRSPGGGGFGFW